MVLGLTGCVSQSPRTGTEEKHTAARQYMVEHDLRGRGIRDARVLAAMLAVPRHRFVAAELEGEAYADRALPIGEGQTISQPYIVGLMTELLEPDRGDTVLEVGTGSGYQAAVLAELGCEVYTVEIHPPLAAAARALLEELGYGSVHVRAGDGYAGWPEAAPFDAVIITAAAPKVPQPLVDQLRDGGHIVFPQGHDGSQTLMRGEKKGSELALEPVVGVMFVPMTGRVRE